MKTYMRLCERLESNSSTTQTEHGDKRQEQTMQIYRVFQEI